MSVNAMGSELALALQYAKYCNGYTQPFTAKGSVTFSSKPSNNDTLSIAGTTYKFVTALATANDVLIGATARETILHLIAAITGGAGASTTYHASTPTNLLIDVEIAGAADVLFVTSWVTGIAGNSLALAQSSGSSARYTLSGSVLAGGVKGGEVLRAVGRIAFDANPADADSITIGSVTYAFKDTLAAAEDVQRGSSMAETMTHLLRVVNGTGTVGVDYYTGSTTPHADVSGEVSNNVLKLTARTAGASTTALTESATGVRVTGSGTLSGGSAAAAYDRSTFAWKKYRTRDIDYGVQQVQDVFPLENLGSLSPAGAYKGGVVPGGGMTFLPRFEDSIGIMLLAALGNCSTVSHSTYGVHTFRFATDESYLPWLTVRKMIPGRQNIPAQGLLAFDNIVSSLRLNFAPASPVEARIDFLGRVPELDNHPEVWPGTAAEDFKSVGITCKGQFALPTVFDGTIPTTAVSLELNNNTTGWREEAIIGSYYMDDIISRSRTLSLQFTHKWDSPAMYQRSFGGVLQSAWSPEPFITETSGSNYAFDLYIEAPFNIPGTSVPYSLRVRANKAFWQPRSDPRLVPGNIVAQDWQCTVLYDPTFYAEFVLTNARTTVYAIPSEP